MTRERLVSPFGVGEVVVETEPARLRPRSAACPGVPRTASPRDRARPREPLRHSPKHFLLDLFTYPNFCGIARNAGLEKSRPLPRRGRRAARKRTPSNGERQEREKPADVRGRQDRADARRRPPDPPARRARKRAVAELRHGPQASARCGRQALRPDDERSSGAARTFLRGAARLLEGRHGLGLRIRRRRHPALLRGRCQISGVEGIPYAARPAAGRLSLHDRPAAPAL